jgi:hypothetical protein
MLSHDYSLKLANENNLEVFHLRKENRKFIYSQLIDYCVGNLSQYVFSRSEVALAKEPSEIQRQFKNAVNKFRQIRNDKDCGEGGELGELLLYLFIENRLNAPKVLSKMEIKTTQNQYVYGADGVFLHQIKDSGGKPIYQFVIGEAKIKNDILEATREAFDSLKTTLDEINIETGLVASSIFKEVCNEEEAEFIKELILPKEDISETQTIHEKAFGVFIGYSVEYDEDIPNQQWNKNVDDKIKEDIGRALNTMKNRITKLGLSGYSFYCYFLPFNKADEDRKSIMDQIL